MPFSQVFIYFLLFIFLQQNHESNFNATVDSLILTNKITFYKNRNAYQITVD